MPTHCGAMLRILPLLALVFAALTSQAQSGNAGAVRGAVTDPSGAVIPNATVHIANDVSQFEQDTTTDATGQFAFYNVPFNPYRISVSAKGFAPLSQNLEIRSSVGTSLKLVLQVTGGTQTVTVEAAGDLIEDDPTFHVDVDRDLFNKVPLESASSTLSSLVTLTTPGVAADSNGLFHGLGDHASNSFSVDGQTITDQQSKVFSNQLPSAAVQSIEVISGAPPAEYGGKTSLVIVATTRSGQGVTKPTGDIYASYGASDRRRAASISPMAARIGATSSKLTASIPAVSSIRLSLPSSTTRATRRTSSIASITAFPPPIRSIGI